jgi:hypothetical protein
MQTETDQYKQAETDKYRYKRASTSKNRQLQAAKKIRAETVISSRNRQIKTETELYKRKQTTANR